MSQLASILANKDKTGREPSEIRAHLSTEPHLSEADSLDDVLVCQREDFVATHCIPHLSEIRVALLTQKLLGTI